MREGENPQRHKKMKMNSYSHRIIIPLYLPEMDGYYKDSFAIFKLCLNSLFKTISKDSAITVINNGCTPVVVDYLDSLYLEGRVDEIIHTQRIGKMNAILKGIRSSNEQYLTITDADVLFKSGWLSETLRIFKAFDKVAVVGLVPQFKMYENFSYNVIFDNFLNKHMKFSDVKDVEDMKMFYKSIDWNDDYNKDYLKYNLSIQKEGVIALVGTGHFVATYKRGLFENDVEYSSYLLGGDSEVVHLDLPPAKKNLWRLNTEGNYAYHMGNILEPWMTKFEEDMEDVSEKVLEFPKRNVYYRNKPLSFFIKQKVFSKMFKKYLKKSFYIRKGLPKKVAKEY